VAGVLIGAWSVADNLAQIDGIVAKGESRRGWVVFLGRSDSTG